MAKLYNKFLDQKNHKIKLLVQEWVNLYHRFWSLSKTHSRASLGLKTLAFTLSFKTW